MIHTFEGTLESAGGPGAWTTLTLPEDVAKELGARRSLAVRGTIDGHPFRSTVMPWGGGGFYLVVNRDVRTAAGVGPGDKVTVTLERDDAPREVEPPEALVAALAGSSVAAKTWERLPPSARKQYAEWIADAKSEETRERRVAKAIELLEQGKRLKGGR